MAGFIFLDGSRLDLGGGIDIDKVDTIIFLVGNEFQPVAIDGANISRSYFSVSLTGAQIDVFQKGQCRFDGFSFGDGGTFANRLSNSGSWIGTYIYPMTPCTEGVGDNVWTKVDVRDGEKGTLVLEIVKSRVVARTEHSWYDPTE